MSYFPNKGILVLQRMGANTEQSITYSRSDGIVAKYFCDKSFINECISQLALY